MKSQNQTPTFEQLMALFAKIGEKLSETREIVDKNAHEAALRNLEAEKRSLESEKEWKEIKKQFKIIERNIIELLFLGICRPNKFIAVSYLK